MFKLFDKINGNYMLPNGKTKTAKEMLADPQYAILKMKDCVVDTDDGILKSYQTLADFASRYGIEYETDDDQDPNEVFQKAIDKMNEEKKLNDNKATLYNNVNTMYNVALISAMSFTDEQALEVKDIYPEYQVDHAYKQGDFFTHEGELYKVNQAHTSASQWEPGSVGTESLYTHLTLNEDGYPIWKQPTGAHDAYNKGDIVEYNGELYKSLIDGNAYSPDTYPAGWEKYTEPEA